MDYGFRNRRVNSTPIDIAHIKRADSIPAAKVEFAVTGLTFEETGELERKLKLAVDGFVFDCNNPVTEETDTDEVRTHAPLVGASS